MATPRNGPCSPWTSGPAVAALPSVAAWSAKQITANVFTEAQVAEICATAAIAASGVLYELSGRMFTGECGPVTIRPVSRPTDSDTRAWPGGSSPNGWFSAWGSASSYGANVPGVLARYGSVEPPTIRMQWPVSEILQVLIDGVLIPGPYNPAAQTGEWELRDHQELVRIRPTPGFEPTQRWGWPTSQVMDLPDNQVGTFSITFTFGQPPPEMGQLAALKLAEMLCLPQLGDTSHYPKRVTQIARQGVTVQVADIVDVMKTGSLGIWEVDAFILAHNPGRNQRQATVYSPDLGRPGRRQPNPSLPT